MNDEEAGVNLKSIMQEENYYVDLLLDDTSVAKRQEDMHDELTNTLDSRQRAHSKTFINKDIFPS